MSVTWWNAVAQQLEDGNRLRGGSERRGDIAALTVDMGWLVPTEARVGRHADIHMLPVATLPQRNQTGGDAPSRCDRVSLVAVALLQARPPLARSALSECYFVGHLGIRIGPALGVVGIRHFRLHGDAVWRDIFGACRGRSSLTFDGVRG